jgi:hypothetical protein
MVFGLRTGLRDDRKPSFKVEKFTERLKVSRVAESLEPRTNQKSTETLKLVCNLLLISRLVRTCKTVFGSSVRVI